MKKTLVMLLALVLCLTTLSVFAEEEKPAYEIFRLESVGTIEYPEGEGGESAPVLYCLDGYMGGFSFENGEENREALGFGEEDWVRLVLNDDAIFTVPADIANDPLETMELVGAEAFAAWWTEQVEGKEFADSVYFLFTVDETECVTAMEYVYLP